MTGGIDLDELASRTLPLLPRPVARAEFVAELRERLQGQGGAVAVHRAGIVTALEAATGVAAAWRDS